MLQPLRRDEFLFAELRQGVRDGGARANHADQIVNRGLAVLLQVYEDFLGRGRQSIDGLVADLAGFDGHEHIDDTRAQRATSGAANRRRGVPGVLKDLARGLVELCAGVEDGGLAVRFDGRGTVPGIGQQPGGMVTQSVQDSRHTLEQRPNILSRQFSRSGFLHSIPPCRTDGSIGRTKRKHKQNRRDRRTGISWKVSKSAAPRQFCRALGESR